MAKIQIAITFDMPVYPVEDKDLDNKNLASVEFNIIDLIAETMGVCKSEITYVMEKKE